MQKPFQTALGFGELLGIMENVRRRNRFVKFLLVFPAAFLAYMIAGGVGPILQKAGGVFEPLIILFQIGIFLHFLGKGNLIEGFRRITLFIQPDVWEDTQAGNSLANKLSDSWLPLLVNIVIFSALIFGLNLGFHIVANLSPVQHFLENWRILYPDAGAKPLFEFWLNNSIIPIILSFIAVCANWLAIDTLAEK